MIKRILPVLFFALTVSNAHAIEVRPLFSIAGGYNATRLTPSQNVTILPPYQNTYFLDQSHQTRVTGGGLLGGEFTLPKEMLCQVGLAFYQTRTFTLQGTINQFADPDLNNLAYTYGIQSRQVVIESKLLATYQTKYHPYIVGNLGEGINRSYGYVESPLNESAVPMQPGFSNAVTHSFAGALGFGLDVDLDQHARIGIGYRFANLGRANLGPSPIQVGTDTLKNDHLYTNQFLVQISLIR